MLIRVWIKGNSCSLFVGIYFGIAVTENNMEVFQKLKIEQPSDPS